jgi:hypothetical protein
MGSPAKPSLESVSTIGVIFGLNFPLGWASCQRKLTLSNIEYVVGVFNVLFLNSNAVNFLLQNSADQGIGSHSLSTKIV